MVFRPWFIGFWGSEAVVELEVFLPKNLASQYPSRGLIRTMAKNPVEK
jgi:hypothetical protein